MGKIDHNWCIPLLVFFVIFTITLSTGFGYASEPTIADFEKPFFGLKRQGTDAAPKTVSLIVIAWQPKGKNEPQLSASQLESLFFGPSDSVAHWFKENSQGRYKLIPHPTHPVLGPYESKYDWPFYWRNDSGYVRRLLCGSTDNYCQAWLDNPYKVPPPENDPHWYEKDGKVYYLDDEGYIGGHTHSWAEAIREADKAIDFSVYDSDNDGNLSIDECLIIVVKAQASTFGTRRTVTGSDVPKTDLVVDGTVVRDVCELYAGPPHSSDDLAVAVEEVLHLAANLADQYPDGAYRKNDDPGRPQQLALTDAGRRPVHIDPYHKLKWGWLTPQLADHSGRYTLRDVATTGDALILYSPYLGTDEFFILENRWRGSGYDRYRHSVYQEGLALWHCIQDPALSQEWARRAVHLRRADPRLDINGNLKLDHVLFDGDDPKRGYNLDDSSQPQNLLFRDGILSQIQIKNISGAGPVMTVDVATAFPPNSLVAQVSKIDTVRVHAKDTGYGPPSQLLTEDGIIELTSTPNLAFGVDIDGSAGRAMFDLLLEVYGNQTDARIEYVTKTAIGGSTLRVILQRYTLEVQKTGDGSGTVSSLPAGIDCGADCKELISAGRKVQLVATADTGSIFEGWSGAAACSNGELTMNYHTSCNATFSLIANLDTDGDGIKNGVDTDDDNDGIPDTWETTYYFDPLNKLDANQDADLDGYTNLREYRHNSNPRDKSSIPSIPVFKIVPILPLLLDD